MAARKKTASKKATKSKKDEPIVIVFKEGALEKLIEEEKKYAKQAEKVFDKLISMLDGLGLEDFDKEK